MHKKDKDWNKEETADLLHAAQSYDKTLTPKNMRAHFATLQMLINNKHHNGEPKRTISAIENKICKLRLTNGWGTRKVQITGTREPRIEEVLESAQVELKLRPAEKTTGLAAFLTPNYEDVEITLTSRELDKLSVIAKFHGVTPSDAAEAIVRKYLAELPAGEPV